MRGIIRSGALMAVAWAISLVLVINLCDVIFRCGCTWIWAGAASRCNIHHAMGPHCPWCSHGWTGFSWVAAAILVAEGAAVLGLRKYGTLIQAAGAGVAFLLAGAAVGLISALLDGYPTWLGLSIR